jgi:hypothetical protein
VPFGCKIARMALQWCTVNRSHESCSEIKYV